MVVFGLQVTKKEAITAIMEIRRNLLVENIVKNPFNGKITAHGKDFFSVVLIPVYPQVYLFAFLPFFSSILFWGTTAGNISFYVGLVIASTVMFWSNTFYFLLFYYKTKGGVKYVTPKKTLMRIV